MNVKFNGGEVLIFPNTFVDLPNECKVATTSDWELEPRYAATLGRSPGVAHIYIYTYQRERGKEIVLIIVL